MRDEEWLLLAEAVALIEWCNKMVAKRGVESEFVAQQRKLAKDTLAATSPPATPAPTYRPYTAEELAALVAGGWNVVRGKKNGGIQVFESVDTDALPVSIGSSLPWMTREVLLADYEWVRPATEFHNPTLIDPADNLALRTWPCGVLVTE